MPACYGPSSSAALAPSSLRGASALGATPPTFATTPACWRGGGLVDLFRFERSLACRPKRWRWRSRVGATPWRTLPSSRGCVCCPFCLLFTRHYGYGCVSAALTGTRSLGMTTQLRGDEAAERDH